MYLVIPRALGWGSLYQWSEEEETKQVHPIIKHLELSHSAVFDHDRMLTFEMRL